ncbi:MAG TPA: hypothetical protein VFL65_00835 [Jatrophihabitans sp.]|nr:hypothetical protein [Jatrophihabitans sp.]
MRLFADEVVIVRPGTTTNRAGDEVDDWTRATRATVPDVLVQPVSQAEVVELGRDVATSLWRLLSARGVDVDLTARDRVEWAGVTHEVVGDVARFRVGGRVHHVEAVLQHVRG